MDDVIQIAKERADRFGVRNVVVATNTGASAERAHGVFGPGYLIIAAGNPASAHERGLVHHQGISDETRSRLEQQGIKVALWDQSFGQKHFDHSGASRCGLAELSDRMRSPDPLHPLTLACNVLDWFCDSTRICIEISALAADAGVLPTAQDCVAIALPSPQSNCPHAAVVLRPARAEDLFRGNLRVKDIALVPGGNDHWFSDQPLWQG